MGSGGRGTLKPSREAEALLALRLLPGVGDRRSARMLEEAGSAMRALALPAAAFASLAGREAEAARREPAFAQEVAGVLEACRRLGIRIVAMGDGLYPRRLLRLTDPPPVLFLRGDPSLLERRTVAVIGSRRSTPVGRRTAERLGRELGERGVVVASGMALGIDGAAHRGALQGPAGTVAVLGSGPDRAYPTGNRPIFRRILREGLVLSEFPPGEGARPHHFPRRNRILAALCRAVVVVEAGRRSGALITVDHALDLGLDVFAVPGSAESPQSRGTHDLIRQGAGLLTEADDLLRELQWLPDPPRRDRRGDSPTPPPSPGPAPEPVLAALGAAPQTLDRLVRTSGLPPSRVLADLTRLEVAGRIVRGGDGWHRREEAG